MELTDDMLRRIANNFADLRLRVSLVEYLVTEESPAAKQFEKVVKQAVDTPDFQLFRNQIFEQLKGGH
jgi:hypothetical protein